MARTHHKTKRRSRRRTLRTRGGAPPPQDKAAQPPVDTPDSGGAKRRGRIPFDVVAVLVGVVAIVVAIGVARGWFTSQAPSVEPTALTATDVSTWFGDRKWVGAQLVVLNNVGGPSRTILWISTRQPTDMSAVVTARIVGQQARANRSRGVKRPSSAPNISSTVVRFWSLDTCGSGPVPITEARPYVLLVNPVVSLPGRIVVPFFESTTHYQAHLNDGKTIDVASAASSINANFRETADRIAKTCGGV